MNVDKINLLKHWAIVSLFASIIFGITTFFLYNLSKEATPSILMNSYKEQLSIEVIIIGVFSILLLLASITMFILYKQRKSGGLAEKIDNNLNNWKENVQQNVFQKEYVIWGKPKHIVFISIYLFILLIVHITLTLMDVIFFNTYSLIMYILFFLGLILFWNMNIAGYIIFWAICIYNIIVIVITLNLSDIILWIYPIISLVNLRKYFIKSRK